MYGRYRKKSYSAYGAGYMAGKKAAYRKMKGSYPKKRRYKW